MVRIGEDPVSMQATDASVTFFYSGGRWIKTQLYSLEWPDLTKILDRDSAQKEPPADFFSALKDIEPFADKLRRVWLREGQVCTSEDGNSGAAVEVPELLDVGLYNIDYLIGLETTAQTMDLGAYPLPVIFYGESVRGAIMGMRS